MQGESGISGTGHAHNETHILKNGDDDPAIRTFEALTEEATGEGKIKRKPCLPLRDVPFALMGDGVRGVRAAAQLTTVVTIIILL